jgi:hypothetical protein
MDRYSAILRSGTPITDMLIKDLPSPSRDPAMMKQMPYTFKCKVLRKKAHAEDPDEFDEVDAYNEPIKVIGLTKVKQKKAHRNYL